MLRSIFSFVLLACTPFDPKCSQLFCAFSFYFPVLLIDSSLPIYHHSPEHLHSVHVRVFPFLLCWLVQKNKNRKANANFCWWRFHCGSQSSELCPSSSASPHTIWFSLLLKHRVRFICFYNLYSVPLCERLPPNCCHQSYNKQYARGVPKELFVICFNGQTFRQIFRLHLVCINNLLIYHIGSTCWRF